MGSDVARGERTGELTARQLAMLEAGSFRFDGYSHAEEVIEAHGLIRAGYVTTADIGGPSYTCILCEISDSGRTLLAATRRTVPVPPETASAPIL